MYPTYVFRTTPSCAGRHVARRAPQQARHLSNGFFPPALFGGARHHPFFGPPASRSGRGDVFDHFDDFVNRSLEGYFPTALNSARNTQVSYWQPRFDVREVDDAYQLRGELPGVDAQDLSVEFTDANRLVIRGSTQSEHTEGQQPQAQAEPAPRDNDATMTSAEDAAKAQDAAAEADKSDTASVHSDSSYVQPTVEDEADVERRESGATAEATADSTVTKQAEQQQQDVQQSQPQQQSRYWVSERSTGSFSRTFEFPGRVDADNVTASLKNGILDVTVPKAKTPEARKIQVQ